MRILTAALQTLAGAVTFLVGLHAYRGQWLYAACAGASLLCLVYLLRVTGRKGGRHAR